MLCLQSAGDGSSAAEDDASGRGDFSNWGRGGEAASGERRREKSLHKAAKLRKRQGFLREEKCKRERAKSGEFWCRGVHFVSELPSRHISQNSEQLASSPGSNSTPSDIHPATARDFQADSMPPQQAGVQRPAEV